MDTKSAKIYKFEWNFQNAYVWIAYIWKDKFYRPKIIAFIKVYFRDTYSWTPCISSLVDIKFALLFLIGRSLSVRWNCVPQNFIYTYFTFKNYYFEFFYLTGRDNYFHVPKTVPVECTHSWWNAGMRSQTDDLHLVRFMQDSDSGKVLLEVSPLEVTSQVWPVKVTKAAALLTVAQVPAIILEVQMLAISRSCSYNIGKKYYYKDVEEKRQSLDSNRYILGFVIFLFLWL